MFSIVDFYGKQSNYSCGYCKQSSSCQSHGMWAHTMTVDDYQDLIDRGWRRSGCYCYKPEMSSTCCPAYTIKCDAMNFKLSKSHKKIIKRMNKFLKDGQRDKNNSGVSSHGGTLGDIGGDLEMGDLAKNPRNNLNISSSDVVPCNETVSVPRPVPVTEKLTDTKKVSKSSTLNLSSNSPEVDTSPKPKKAKLLRIARKREKLVRKGFSVDEIERNMREVKGKNVEKSLEDFLDEAPKEDEEAAHRLKVKLVPSSEGAADLTFGLYCSYQAAVHQDSPSKLKMDRYKRFLVKSPLKLVTVCTASDEFKRSLEVSFVLYKKYQTEVHNDPPLMLEDYTDFLVKSPLKFTIGQNAPSCGLGSFHQQYWLDDRLIAVGVIDILSHCVSSVYFFYDPEFRFLSLGTYGSLREIAFTRKLQQQLDSITSYYMGFYIHSCPKMRYKSNLSPSHLLCPEVFSWHALDDSIIRKLDANKYSRLNEDSEATDQGAVQQNDLVNVLVLNGSTYMRYSSYMEMENLTTPEEIVLTYSKLVGKACALRMLLYRG